MYKVMNYIDYKNMNHNYSYETHNNGHLRIYHVNMQ